MMQSARCTALTQAVPSLHRKGPCQNGADSAGGTQRSRHFVCVAGSYLPFSSIAKGQNGLDSAGRTQRSRHFVYIAGLLPAAFLEHRKGPGQNGHDHHEQEDEDQRTQADEHRRQACHCYVRVKGHALVQLNGRHDFSVQQAHELPFECCALCMKASR
eukprot:1160335-Pelagomonas_calceolata.AAC.14